MATAFSWPVVPGVRFLLPWLRLAAELPQLLKSHPGDEPVLEAVVFAAGSESQAHGGPAWQRWFRPEDGDQRCGLILTVTGGVAPGGLCRGILRHLVARRRRLGATSLLFNDVLACDLSRVDTLVHATPGSLSGGEPPAVDLDLEVVEGKTLVVAFTWEPPRQAHDARALKTDRQAEGR